MRSLSKLNVIRCITVTCASVLLFGSAYTFSAATSPTSNLPDVETSLSTSELLVVTLSYDILKQQEKLQKDVPDIKETDLHKFKFVCNDVNFNAILLSFKIM